MHLPFLNREREMTRITRAIRRPDDAMFCVYGRRRLGKSRLLQKVIEKRPSVYFMGDEREASVQRQALAREIDHLLPSFAAVHYPGWFELFERFWNEAPKGTVLVLDELPSMVAAAPELPSLLQKIADRRGKRGRKVILCGSSQRMMQGLVLDATAPLYGRAEEILKIEPLGVRTLKQAFRLRKPMDVLERWAVWGGVPRYWELALDYPNHATAVRELVLDPLGVLHREPERLLLDEVPVLSLSSSILAMIGQGCHRISEIGARLEQPATNLSRPLGRLVELGFVEREVPFSAGERDSKRSLYQLGDPLLRFVYRFVEPARSRLAAGHCREVEAVIAREQPRFLGEAWEMLARRSAAQLRIDGTAWKSASRYWGKGSDGSSIEIDVLATAAGDASRVLVGEAKLACTARELPRVVADLKHRASVCPPLMGKRLTFAVWVLSLSGKPGQLEAVVVDPHDVLDAL
jgi:hypothetical protein